jgi:D-glycero-D-manno-heptose 1,7-bisphosphate phosphatase
MNRAVFLDRDGVLNRAIVREGKPYAPTATEAVDILPGVQEAIVSLKAAGYITIVVTNQPDVGRGNLQQSIAEDINARVKRESGVDEIRVCYHSGDQDCICRKPKPGMLLQAADEHNLSLAESFMIGDRWRDIDAGKAAGCKTIWIRSNYSEWLPNNADAIVESMAEAARFILARGV